MAPGYGPCEDYSTQPPNVQVRGQGSVPGPRSIVHRPCPQPPTPNPLAASTAAASEAGGGGEAAKGGHGPHTGGGADSQESEGPAPAKPAFQRWDQADGEHGQQEAEAGLQGEGRADVLSLR